MSRPSRDIQKILADFGERQFNETGAQSVEVLRVKAAVIRKYWKQMKGIAFLAAVVSSDRVRVYFFNPAGVMLIAENITHDQYQKVRSKSKLVRKFEKPTPPTELELRMEATEELRNELSKAIRKVARFLGAKEPQFPSVFVTSQKLDASGQGFGLAVEEDDAFLFEEGAINSRLFSGISIRAALLALLEKDKARGEFGQCLGNTVASTLLKGAEKEVWDQKWLQESKVSMIQPIVFHLYTHIPTYGASGLAKLLSIAKKVPANSSPSQWIAALEIIHTSHEVPLGTESWHTIDSFCQTLGKSRKLDSKRYHLQSIHLSPRIIPNPVPLGISLGLKLGNTEHEKPKNWLEIRFHESGKLQTLSIREDSGKKLDSIKYILRIQDIIPKTGGIESKGADVLRWALRVFGIGSASTSDFSASIQMMSKPISESEKAVLERLCSGSLEILANSLIGSPQRVESLIDSQCIVLVPDFAHVGLHPNLLVVGPNDDVLTAIENNVVEATILTTDDEMSYAIISAPSAWYQRILGNSNELLSIYPVASSISERRLIRHENLFPNEAGFTWGS